MKKVLLNECYGGYECYGGFKICKEGIKLLIHEFPEKAAKYGWKIQKKTYDFVRDDQEVIEFMINTGLEKFQGNSCVLSITEIHPLLNFKIREYEGFECIETLIDYKNIICDLINRIKGCDINDNSPVTEMMLLQGYEEVIEILNK